MKIITRFLRALIVTVTISTTTNLYGQLLTVDSSHQIMSKIDQTKKIEWLKQYSKGFVSKNDAGGYTFYNKRGKEKSHFLIANEIPSKTLLKLFKNDTLEIDGIFSTYQFIGKQFEGVFHGEFIIQKKHSKEQQKGEYQFGKKTGKWVTKKSYGSSKSFISDIEEYEYGADENTLNFIEFNSDNDTVIKGNLKYIKDNRIKSIYYVKRSIEYDIFSTPIDTVFLGYSYDFQDDLCHFKNYINDRLIEEGYISTTYLFQSYLGIYDENNNIQFDCNYKISDILDDIHVSEEFLVGTHHWLKNPKRIRTFKNGRLNGWTVNYHNNGVVSDSLFYINDTLNGKAVCFHDNSKVKSRGEYLKGKKNGIWKYYDAFGDLIKTLDYSNHISSIKSKCNVIVPIIRPKTAHLVVSSVNKKYALTNNFDLRVDHQNGSSEYSLWDLDKKKIVKQDMSLDLRNQFGCYGCDVGTKYMAGMKNLKITNDGLYYYQDTNLYDIETGLLSSQKKSTNKTYKYINDYRDEHIAIEVGNIINNTISTIDLGESNYIEDYSQDSLHAFILTENMLLRYDLSSNILDTISTFSKSGNYLRKLVGSSFVEVKFSIKEDDNHFFVEDYSITDITTNKKQTWVLNDFVFGSQENNKHLTPEWIDVVHFNTNVGRFIVFQDKVFQNFNSKIIELKKNGSFRKFGLENELIKLEDDYGIYNTDNGLVWYYFDTQEFQSFQKKVASVNRVIFNEDKLYLGHETAPNPKGNEDFFVLDLKNFRTQSLKLSNEDKDTMSTEFDPKEIFSRSEVSSFMFNSNLDIKESFDFQYQYQTADYNKTILTYSSNYSYNYGFNYSRLLFINENKLVPVEKYVSLIQLDNKDFIFYTDSPTNYQNINRLCCWHLFLKKKIR